ncbi:3-oxoacyl-(acyl-carrier-) reductase [Fusarium agapanthi]|uniref:3-oxoacyl-(Acyl-carrier-) reductase n=1 Tax=Fusarium agapanthi TaxID=1803897 RepID=A0A9P5B7Z0_9HYPO|nr:3-oxoacyl-(acyl-carrier-) reductase [Fusarium agapanthi]
MDNIVSFTKTWRNTPYPSIDPTRPELSSAGKLVAITGGGTGIGGSIAIAFAQIGASTIAILGRRLDRLEAAVAEIAEASGGKTNVIFEAVDISQRSKLDAAVTRLVKREDGAKVDIPISNAGVASDMGTVVGFDEAEFRRGIELNVVGAFNTLQTFGPCLTSNAYVFNTSTGMVHLWPIAQGWAYAPVKAAVFKMFQYLQDDNPKWHVVQIQPGVIRTELNERFDVVGQDDPSLAAQLYVWLASPEAECLKGKFVWVNWDVDELKARADGIKGSLLFKMILSGVPM